MKGVSLVILVFLTLTVVAYNHQFHNIPSYMFLNAYNLAQKRVTEFRMTLPSNGIPHEYRDVTEDDGFRARVIDYVIACDVIRTGMKIEEYDLPYDWLKDASNSSKGYDMTIKFFDDFYFLQVRYYPDFRRTSIERTILWTINIVTVFAWVLFAFKSLGKTQNRNKRNEAQNPSYVMG